MTTKTKQKESEMKNPGGAPSKRQHIQDRILMKLFKRGFTDAEVCDVVGINRITLQRWKKDNKLCVTIKNWKEEADGKVERSLYESACGFTTKSKKAVVVSDGRDSGSHVEMVIEEIQHPPNSTSIIFWLKNRKSREWRDKQVFEHELGDTFFEKYADMDDHQLMNRYNRICEN